MWIADLKDRYGEYGKIGLVLIEKNNCQRWTLKLLLTSCRVMSRGIGGTILKWLVNYTISHKIELYAEFVSTDRNRIMEITYLSLGFRLVCVDGDVRLLRRERQELFEMPDYLSLVIKSI